MASLPSTSEQVTSGEMDGEAVRGSRYTLSFVLVVGERRMKRGAFGDSAVDTATIDGLLSADLFSAVQYLLYPLIYLRHRQVSHTTALQHSKV